MHVLAFRRERLLVKLQYMLHVNKYNFQMRLTLVTATRVGRGYARELPLVSRASARPMLLTMTAAILVTLPHI